MDRSIKNLEELSDLVARGIPIGAEEALAVIAYQNEKKRKIRRALSLPGKIWLFVFDQIKCLLGK